MARIAQGRWTHTHTGDLTVFLIGMRINRLWRPDAWLPTLAAMGPMLRELVADPGSGFLGYRLTLGLRGPVLVQYWRRVEDVYRYAADREARHRPAWAAFNRRARRVPGAVGVWHETFEVARAESVYVDLPVVGLAAATEALQVTDRLDRAADRLAG
jgi:Monooxygenase af470-like